MAEDEVTKPELVVGAVLTPNYFIQDDQTTLGLDYEILKAYADEKGYTLNIKIFNTLSSLANALNNDEVQLIAGNLNTDFNKVAPEYATQSYLLENLVVVAYSEHHKSTVHFPSDSDTVYQAAVFDYPNLPFSTVKLPVNQNVLYSYVGQNKRVDGRAVDYIITTSNRAKALNQLYPTVKTFPVLIDSQTQATINDVFFIKNNELRDSFNNFLTDFLESDQYDKIKFNNLRQLENIGRAESRQFVLNMQTKFNKYSGLFQQYSTNMDWRLVMAVGYQESRWTPNAVSPWGPSGFMMLTNASAKALGVTNKLDATQSIREGTRLLMRFKNNLTSDITGYDRDMYAISNYNQGIAKIIDARTWLKQRNLDPNSWVVLAQKLPEMSYSKHRYGKINGRLTSEYIINVRRWYFMLLNYIYFYQP
ncbi:transglycosylase SLT domain-containing protein [Psittacicella hinzii]|uniref:transglycosylase SLT domain-containing protein n=1 Tax=Psittacicella hinzii TaxID=2028575 RepID=UPI0036D3AA99